jgi:hypothetical protein
VTDVDAPLEEQVFDLPQRQRITNIHHHREADHLGRAVEIAEGIAHRRRLRSLARRLKPIYSDNALVGFAAAWNDPAVAGLADQTTLEAFYRYQFSDNIAITADAQLLLNPSLHPTEDQIAVFGLRARVNM